MKFRKISIQISADYNHVKFKLPSSFLFNNVVNPYYREKRVTTWNNQNKTAIKFIRSWVVLTIGEGIIYMLRVRLSGTLAHFLASSDYGHLRVWWVNQSYTFFLLAFDNCDIQGRRGKCPYSFQYNFTLNIWCIKLIQYSCVTNNRQEESIVYSFNKIVKKLCQ